MSDIFNVVKEIEAIDNQRKEKINSIKNNFKDHLLTYLKPVFDQYKNLDYIRFIGYTPNFNDGEPCKHRSYIDLDEYEGDDAWMNNETTSKTLNENLTRDEIEEISKYAESIETIVEAVYYTNYEITVLRDGDELSVDVNEEYDCGY
jgi:predicted house-cleaning noncanonical NTP pyrophosphatase (MazG superfamily)